MSKMTLTKGEETVVIHGPTLYHKNPLRQGRAGTVQMAQQAIQGASGEYGDFIPANTHVSDDPGIQAEYERLRADGVGHNLANMFAHQTPPRGKDNTSWLAANSRAIGGGDLAPPVRQHHEAMAKAAGVNIEGKVYMPGLARQNMPGDPKAWVSDHSEFKKRLEDRGDGWSDGTQSVRARDDFAPTPDIEVAPDLVEERACQMIENNPDLLHKHCKLKGDNVAISGELLHEAKESCKSNSER